MTPEERRRESAADRLAYAATMLSEALTSVASRTTRLDERIRAAVKAGVPQHHVEAMMRDGLEALPFPGVRGMIQEAYAELYEVTGKDTVMWCVAHRRRVIWGPSPMWWIHDDNLVPLGHPGDPRGCSFMWAAPAPITMTRKDLA